MPVKMTQRQLDFWRELLAPFHPSELDEKPARGGGGGKMLTWINKRSMTNRLDSVCGPHGWKVRYEANQRGYKATLSIRCPLDDGTWEWIEKEDGGGFEEMSDVDNDEKSGYTNALRRAAQDAWGIGRYIYGKGIPAFCDPGAVPIDPFNRPPYQASGPATAASEAHGAAHEAMAEHGQRRPQPAQAAPAQPRQQAPAGDGQANRSGVDFSFPRPGKGVFSWAKRMEEHFQTSLVNGMKATGDKLGFGTILNDWDADQINAVCEDVAGYIRSLDNYKGEFDGGREPAPKPTAAEPAPPPAPSAEALAKVGPLKKDLVHQVKALLTKTLGRNPSEKEIVDNLAVISADSANGAGHKGEAMTSMKSCADEVWLRNMAENIHARLQKAMATPEDDEIPF